MSFDKQEFIRTLILVFFHEHNFWLDSDIENLADLIVVFAMIVISYLMVWLCFPITIIISFLINIKIRRK